MRLRLLNYLLISCLCTLLFSACSNTRFLTGDQVLYTGISKIEITDKENLKKNKATKEAIKTITFSKPNNALFGTRRVMVKYFKGHPVNFKLAVPWVIS